MRFGFAMLQWVEAIDKKTLHDIFLMAINGSIPWEFYLMACVEAGKCVGI